MQGTLFASETATTSVSVHGGSHAYFESVIQRIDWYPDYGAAVVSLQNSSAHNRTSLNIICLDGWEVNLHRYVADIFHVCKDEWPGWRRFRACLRRSMFSEWFLQCRVYSDGPNQPPRLQPTAKCRSSIVHTVHTHSMDLTRFAILKSLIQGVLDESRTSSQRVPRHAGFLAAVISQAVGFLGSQDSANIDTGDMFAEAITQANSFGIFRDVGRNSGADLLPTCWGLVRESVSFVAEQVSPELHGNASMIDLLKVKFVQEPLCTV